jgi:hypothetical protein
VSGNSTVERTRTANRVAVVSTLLCGLLLAAPSTAWAGSTNDSPTGGPISEAQAVTLALTAVPCRDDGPSAGDSEVAAAVRGQIQNTRMGGTISAYQVSCARAIVEQVRARRLTERAAVIAVTTAMAETTLHNWDGGDRDSLGLFQQRPSMGWGDPADLVRPSYATNAFLNAMIRKYPDNAWQTANIGAVCQTVQVSAVPEAYGREVHNATVVVNALWNRPPERGNTVGDYNGDGQTDRAVFRPSTGEWWIQYYRTNATAKYTWGQAGDVPVPGDYNGDGQYDRAVFRPSTGEWWIQYYRTNATAKYTWGQAGDVPVPGDYNGDGQHDRAVFRPSTGEWWIQYYRTNGTAKYTWGQAGDVPVPGDYNGDGQHDRAVFRPSTGEWWIQYYGSNGTAKYTWGQAGDVPVPGDYNGDGQHDRAVFRPSTGEWRIQYYRTDGTAVFRWGQAGDIPAPGDYNGDGQHDRAVFRPSTGEWWIQYYRTGGTAVWDWGQNGDRPVTT